MTVVNIFSLIFCALICELSYKFESIQAFISSWLLTSLNFVLIHFLIFGVVASFLTKFIAEKFMRKDEKVSIHSPEGGQAIEPMYAFDIHCNGFFPVVVFCYFGNVSQVFFHLSKGLAHAFWGQPGYFFIVININSYCIYFECTCNGCLCLLLLPYVPRLWHLAIP